MYIIIGIILAIYIILRLSVTVSYRANSETDEIKLYAKWLWFTIYPRPDKSPKTIKIKKSKDKKKTKTKNTNQTLKEDISEIEEEFTELTEDELDERIKSLESELESQKKSLNQAREDTDKKINLEKANIQKKKTTKKSKEDKPKKNGLKAKVNNIRKRWQRYKDFVPMTWKSFRKLLKQIRFYDTEIEITAGKNDAYDAAMNYGRLNAVLFHGIGVVGTIFTLYKPKRAEVKCVFDKKVFEYKLSGKIKIRPSTVLAIVIVFGVQFLCMFLKKRHKAKKQYKLKRKLINNKELLTNE